MGVAIMDSQWTLLFSLVFMCVMWEAEVQCRNHANDLDYCDTEVFRAECSEGYVIMMTLAHYGRMKVGRCVTKDMGYIGCKTDVLEMADRSCSGKRVCEIRVPNAEFESVRDCMVELKCYLTANYSCIPVQSVSKEHCEMHNELNVTSKDGYISSLMLSEVPGCISASHPYVIRALPGQRINLTMYDFGLRDEPLITYNVPGEEVAPPAQKCYNYGIIKEPSMNEVAICGGQQRVSSVYLSNNNEVSLYVTNDHNSVFNRFLIHYSVIGCPDPVLPPAAWFDRTSHKHGYIRCKYDPVAWEKICEGHVWTGHHGNCSLQKSGIAIAIIIGAALGLTLVLAIVCFFRYRRRRNRRFPSNRESILLRQKTAAECNDNGTKVPAGGATLQPVTHIPEAVHLTSDTDMPKGQSLSANSTPKCAHHHYHNVKINGSDYEHIWQSPLPNYPTLKTDLIALKSHHNREPTYTTFKSDKKDSVRPMYIASMDLFTGRAKVKEQSPYETCRYSTLPVKGHTRNNSCSKHQDLLL